MKAPRILRWLLPSPGLLRVTAYGIFAFAVLALFAARALYADVKEAALSIGHELASIGDLLQGQETVLVNGERMHHASTYVDEELAVVLDRLEAYCASSPSVVGRALNSVPKEFLAKIEKRDMPNHASTLGIVRQESRGRGMIACFTDARPAGLLDFKERLARFLATLRLSEFGQFRYFYAEQKPGAHTHVVTTWADTGLDLRAMFPSEGDASGADSLVVPRPPHARRTLSAAAEGVPYGLRMYTSASDADAVKAFYNETLKERRFEALKSEGESDGATAFLRDDGYQVFVSLTEREGQTFVTLTEAGRADGPNVAAVRVTSE